MVIPIIIGSGIKFLIRLDLIVLKQSCFSEFVHKTQQSQGQRKLWMRGYELWLKLIFLYDRRFSTEMESLFFCLIKRTKNQGFGMVVKAQISNLWEISLRGALFCSLLKGWFCRWSFAKLPTKKSSFIPFQNYSLIVESKI